MMKTIRKTAIVMLLFVYFLTYGVLPQVLAAGKDTPMIVVAHRAGAKVAPENTLAALKQAIRDGAPIAEIDVQQLSDGTLIVMHDSNFKRTAGEDLRFNCSTFGFRMPISYFRIVFTLIPVRSASSSCDSSLCFRK